MAVSVGIGTNNCAKGRAGINCFWVVDCKKVLDLIFDADRCVTAIVMDASQPDPVWVKFGFERDTAFLSQPKTRVKAGLNVTQTLSFIEPVLDKIKSNALEDLNDCCCLLAIVRDNNNRYHFLGINYDPKSGEWSANFMQTGDGAAETGADPNSDSSEFTETLTTTSNWYARYFTGGEAGIPV